MCQEVVCCLRIINLSKSSYSLLFIKNSPSTKYSIYPQYLKKKKSIFQFRENYMCGANFLLFRCWYVIVQLWVRRLRSSCLVYKSLSIDRPICPLGRIIFILVKLDELDLCFEWFSEPFSNRIAVGVLHLEDLLSKVLKDVRDQDSSLIV